MQLLHQAQASTPTQHATGRDPLRSALAAAGHSQPHRAAGACLSPCILQPTSHLCPDFQLSIFIESALFETDMLLSTLD